LRPKEIETSKNREPQNVRANYLNLKPIATEAFGGRMKTLWKTVWDNTDLAKVELWTEELDKKSSSNHY